MTTLDSKLFEVTKDVVLNSFLPKVKGVSDEKHRLDYHLHSIGDWMTEKQKKTVASWPAVVHPEKFVGIEIELEGCRQQVRANNDILTGILNDYALYWVAKPDGSLRNNGQEFITRTGMSMQLLPMALESFDNMRAVFYPASVANARTGLHVHYNVGGMTLNQLFSTLLFYAALEPAFFANSGNRNESVFCVPWQYNIQTLGSTMYQCANAVLNGNYARTWRWRNYSKYSALNLAPIATLGTIEFRMHEGTANIGRILDWTKSIDRLFSWAAQFSFEQAYLYWRKARTNEKYATCLHYIFGHDFHEQVIADCKRATVANLVGFVNKDCLPEIDGVHYGHDLRADIPPPRPRLGRVRAVEEVDDFDDRWGERDEDIPDEDNEPPLRFVQANPHANEIREHIEQARQRFIMQMAQRQREVDALNPAAAQDLGQLIHNRLNNNF